MKKQPSYFFRQLILISFLSSLILSTSQAAQPLWVFSPHSPTEITLTKNSNTQVIYTVRSLSSKPKTLVMRPIAGVQSTTCQLAPKGSCTLTLKINGSALQGDVLGGPILCDQGNVLQCYQPNSVNILRIHLVEPTPTQQFTITPSADANGSISPAIPQVVNAGSNLTFTATPNAGFGVNQWLIDGNVVQSGGINYQLNNIQANHAVMVTFGQATLSPLTQILVLSINSSEPGALPSNPALTGNERVIRIENAGSVPASNVQVNSSGLPDGTSITSNTCTGTLSAGATCDVTITPGGNASASLDNSNNTCALSPGAEPEPATVVISANNTSATSIDVLVLGYGCIYQGGFLFAIDDATPNTQSIGGKVAALTDETPPPPTQWATGFGDTEADSIIDGFENTQILADTVGQYPAAEICLSRTNQGFSDWYLPAICELGRYYPGQVTWHDAGCGELNPNLYSTLYGHPPMNTNRLGGFIGADYWSSTEYDETNSWIQGFFGGGQRINAEKTSQRRVRCIRQFTP